MKQQIKIKHPTDIFAVTEKWKKRREENFLAITLNGEHIVIRVHHISKGLVNKTIAHPRECFIPVIKDYSVAVVFVHNHPSGNVEPSHEDDLITDRLCMAGVILGINVLDHIIVTPNNNFYSYRQEKKLREEYSIGEQKLFIAELVAEGSI